jgi:hypothetical protein
VSASGKGWLKLLGGCDDVHGFNFVSNCGQRYEKTKSVELCRWIYAVSTLGDFKKGGGGIKGHCVDKATIIQKYKLNIRRTCEFSSLDKDLQTQRATLEEKMMH